MQFTFSPVLVLTAKNPEQVWFIFVPLHEIVGGIGRDAVDFCVVNCQVVLFALLVGKPAKNS